MNVKPRIIFYNLILLLFFTVLNGYCFAMEGPDNLTIDQLAQLYEPVAFDHAMHVEVAEKNCAKCHHHTTGMPPVDESCIKCHKKSGPADEVACQGCHPANRFEADYLKKLDDDKTIYHTGKVGLKAAYHLKCLGCHKEMGAPTGCQDCHPRNDAGDKFFHAGQYAPPAGQAVAPGGHN